jgi:lincosamide nucleotidyltransferase B/F
MPTPRTDLLLSRLNAIGDSLAQSNGALALIGLGSVGVELERLDDYSDLDFFVMVEPGHKPDFIHQLDWLRAVSPIAYAFRNSADGYKVLFEDGVFCEFAIFEEAELHYIPFAAGRLVWKKAGVPDALSQFPSEKPNPEPPAVDWSLGEALTNLYVGLGRYRRGEKLSAMRFIQGYAVDRLLELSESLEPATASGRSAPSRDTFARERRYEQRHPQLAQVLPDFTQGYDRSVESARALLAFLESHFDIPAALKRAILDLCDPPASTSSS